MVDNLDVGTKFGMKKGTGRIDQVGIGEPYGHLLAHAPAPEIAMAFKFININFFGQ